MSNRYDGGQAFPRPSGPGQEGVNTQAQIGMTLRDWFAGQALAGIMASKENMPFHVVAPLAYSHADAMLEVRGGAA